MRSAALLLFLAGCATPSPVPAPALLPPASSNPAADAAIRAAVQLETPKLVDLYKWFHANPEPSLKEEKTAARFAEEVRAAGWDVSTGIGGHGVAAIFRNGDGPTLLVRIDMDALPVKEQTGLEYAATGDFMHACGHDLHLAAGIGIARVLPATKDRWKGTVLLIGQPAEELGLGAKHMIEDAAFAGIVAKSGRPSWCLSLHDTNSYAAGVIGLCAGWATANVDTIDLTIYGKGGHGAYPHQTIDPIVIASEIVLSLQTIVSRRLKPGTPAVVTVGSIHGGTKHNIIPDSVKLQLTVRSYEDPVRERLLAEIKRVAEEISRAHGAPKPPEMKIDPDWTPAGYHDPALTERMGKAFASILGAERIRPHDPVMGGEDFSRFPRHFGIPGLQFAVGATDPALISAGAEVPSLHSARWAPVPEPTLRTAVTALAKGVVELLPR